MNYGIKWRYLVLLLALIAANWGNTNAVAAPKRDATAEVLLIGDCDCSNPGPSTADPSVLLPRPQLEAPGTRGELDPLIPYIISPRSTYVFNDRPLFRWNAVPGATRYEVSLFTEESGIIWETEVSGTEIVYNGETPLEPETDYLLIVQSDTGASSQQEDIPNRNFRILSPHEADYVRSALSRLERQEMNPEDRALIEAYLYIGYYLRADAIDTLEKSVEAGSQNPEVYRVLGDLYLQVKLIPIAEERYQKALELYEARGDSQGAGELRERLQELNL